MNTNFLFFLIFATLLIFLNYNSITKVVALSSNQTTSIINNNDNTPNSLNLKDVIYEAKSGNLVSQKVLTSSVGIPQLEQTIVEHGKISGIGNVTNIQTWIDTLRTPKLAYGEGKGIITSGDVPIATWIGYDIGQTQGNGTIVYKGITFFNSEQSVGKTEFLNNLIGLHITILNGNNQTTTIWKW